MCQLPMTIQFNPVIEPPAAFSAVLQWKYENMQSANKKDRLLQNSWTVHFQWPSAYAR